MPDVKIDELGQIHIPLEVNKKLHLQNNDCLKVSVKSDHILIIPLRNETDIDEDLLKALTHEGVLIDVTIDR